MSNVGIYKSVVMTMDEQFLLSDTHVAGVWQYLGYDDLQKIECVAKYAIEKVKEARERLGIHPIPPKEENVE